MNEKDLKHFRELLLKERERVLEELNWIETNYIGKSQKETSGEVSGYSMHPADMGTDSMEREKAYLIGAAGGEALENIDEALRSIAKGAYGICETCGEEISRERLEAMPSAKLCINCKSGAEGSAGGSG